MQAINASAYCYNTPVRLHDFFSLTPVWRPVAASHAPCGAQTVLRALLTALHDTCGHQSLHSSESTSLPGHSMLAKRSASAAASARRCSSDRVASRLRASAGADGVRPEVQHGVGNPSATTPYPSFFPSSVRPWEGKHQHPPRQPSGCSAATMDTRRAPALHSVRRSRRSGFIPADKHAPLHPQPHPSYLTSPTPPLLPDISRIICSKPASSPPSPTPSSSPGPQLARSCP
jgi:hypothetical protein